MQETNLAAIDLNLLIALDALLAERSVTRAAARLGLSQPAVSHALARLRDLTRDPLLVRHGSRLVATPRAETLGPAVRAILDEIRRTLAGDQFEPKSARRAFSVANADFTQLVLMPPLLRYLEVEAPGIDLVIRPVPEDPPAALAAGEIDLVIGADQTVAVGAALQRRRLFDEDFVCVVRRDHPALGTAMSVERFAAMGHVFIAPRGTRGGVVDDALARRGLTRRVVAMVPSFVAAPAIVADTDLVLTLPRRLAARLAEPFGLVAFPPPLALPRFTIVAVWHPRLHHDPAHAWLRDALAAVSREMRAEGARARTGSRRRPSA